MQAGLGAIHVLTDEVLTFVKQLGVPNIIMHSPDLPGDGYYDFQALLRLRTRVEAAGLTLYAIENTPNDHMDLIRRGVPGRDKQIENLQKTIRNMGRAGIHTLGYHFIVLGVWRTEHSPRGRGGARVTIYDHELVKNAPLSEFAPITAEQMWANLEYMLKAVVPVAEEEGVMLALHPDDPPVPEIAGVARIIGSLDAYRRVMKIVDSPANGLEFCQGTVTEMDHTPEEIYDFIREFAGKISYVHFRNVDKSVPAFAETFIDEGRLDMLKAMRAYKEGGYKGVFIVDHTPNVIDDTPWGHRGRAYGIGYIKALMRCVMEGC